MRSTQFQTLTPEQMNDMWERIHKEASVKSRTIHTAATKKFKPLKVNHQARYKAIRRALQKQSA